MLHSFNMLCTKAISGFSYVDMLFELTVYVPSVVTGDWPITPSIVFTADSSVSGSTVEGVEVIRIMNKKKGAEAPLCVYKKNVTRNVYLNLM